MPADYTTFRDLPIWHRLLRLIMKPTVETPHFERIVRGRETLYVGHFKDKSTATYELDALYAFFLDEGVPPEYSIFDELELLFSK